MPICKSRRRSKYKRRTYQKSKRKYSRKTNRNKNRKKTNKRYLGGMEGGEVEQVVKGRKLLQVVRQELAAAASLNAELNEKMRIMEQQHASDQGTIAEVKGLLGKVVADRDSEIDRLKQSLSKKQGEGELEEKKQKALRREMQERRAEREELQRTILEKDKEIEALQRTEQGLRQEIATLQDILSAERKILSEQQHKTRAKRGSSKKTTTKKEQNPMLQSE